MIFILQSLKQLWFYDEWKVKKAEHLFQMEIFCNIYKCLKSQFNTSFLNKKGCQ